MKKVEILVVILLALVTCLAGCNSNNLSPSIGMVIISDDVELKSVDAVNLFTAIPHVFNVNITAELILDKQDISDIDIERDYVSYITESSSLYIDTVELFYITQAIMPTYEVFQHSSSDWFTQKELSFKTANSVQHELESLLTLLGLNTGSCEFVSLDKDSLKSARDMLITDPFIAEQLEYSDELNDLEGFKEAYYFEFDILLSGLPLNDIEFENPERYQYIPKSKVYAMVSSDGLQYLFIANPLYPKDTLKRIHPISSKQALQYVVDRQSHLINSGTITIQDIDLVYIAVQKYTDTIVYDIFPAWSIRFDYGEDIGYIIIDAVSGVEIV